MSLLRLTFRSYTSRTRISSIFLDPDAYLSKTVKVCGWARSVRSSNKNFCFLTLTDGSSAHDLQVVIDSTLPNFPEAQKATTGASFMLEGTLVPSQSKSQPVELQLSHPDKHKLHLFGEAKEYPLAKKKHSLEVMWIVEIQFLREKAHLRPRTRVMGAVNRIRNCLAFATHEFFQQKGFLYVHTPIITGQDCEGAGEMFRVSTLPQRTLGDIPTVTKGPDDWEGRRVDFGKELLGKEGYLTVSGQLQVENYCCALGDCYTFGPTFRAENSNTSRHLAEFWMIEPELAFASLSDTTSLASSYLKHCLSRALSQQLPDLHLLSQFHQSKEVDLPGLLSQMVEREYRAMEYSEAVEALGRGKMGVEWGQDLGSEQEKYLVREVGEGLPLLVQNYPKNIKPFYMKLNDDGRTVQGFDLLVPRIGELIGGSAREDHLPTLDSRLRECGLAAEDYWWYRELRQFGSIPHAGFGLGFERLVMLATGMENIRDVIPFPRTPGSLDF